MGSSCQLKVVLENKVIGTKGALDRYASEEAKFCGLFSSASTQ
jgi:hypothetical protein